MLGSGAFWRQCWSSLKPVAANVLPFRVWGSPSAARAYHPVQLPVSAANGSRRRRPRRPPRVRWLSAPDRIRGGREPISV